jgi:hypothetical protein
VTDVVGVAQESTDVSGEELPEQTDSANETIYVARSAVCLLRLPRGFAPMFTTPQARDLANGVANEVCSKLESDPRVVTAKRQGPHEVHNARTDKFLGIDDEAENAVTAIVEYLSLRLNEPIVFEVRVPRKNQYKYRGVDDVPSDEYLAAWDGQSLFVQWTQTAAFSTGSGGHVVLDILAQAVRAAGYEIEIIACAPTCHHRFLHVDYVTFEGEPPDHFHLNGEVSIGESVTTPWSLPLSPLQNLQIIYERLATITELYGEAVSVATAVQHLESEARMDAEVVLKIAHQRSSRRRLPNIFGWVTDTWKLRGSSSYSRELTAELWYALVSIDTKKHRWVTIERRLRQLSDEHGLSEVSSILDVNNTAMESIDVEILKSSVQEVSARREGNVLAMATFVGALAALAGAALGSVLQSIWS